MKTFRDNADRVWTISINISSVKRVRELCKDAEGKPIDLCDVDDGTLFDQLSNNPILLCDIIYCIIQPEADRLGVSDVQFGEAMAGDAFDHAVDAFLEELINFFPQGKRQILMKLLAKAKAYQEKVMKLANLRIENLDLEKNLNGITQEDTTSSAVS